MPLPAIGARRHVAHVSPVRESATAYSEERRFRLRRILEAGGFSIHDIVNGGPARRAVSEQWRLLHRMEEDRAVESYIGFLEYVDAVSQGVLPPSARPRPSLFSI